MCVKLNNTNSPVFQEFEHFLKDELKIKLKPLSPFLDTATDKNDFAIKEVA